MDPVLNFIAEEEFSLQNNLSNITNTTDELLDDFEYRIPFWRIMIWNFVFGAMCIVAVVGNVVIVWIVFAHKRMRSVTNYLLVSNSIADIIASTVNVIPNYMYMVTRHWPFGNIYCKFVQFVAVLSICASVFSLTTIALER